MSTAILYKYYMDTFVHYQIGGNNEASIHQRAQIIPCIRAYMCTVRAAISTVRACKMCMMPCMANKCDRSQQRYLMSILKCMRFLHYLRDN